MKFQLEIDSVEVHLLFSLILGISEKNPKGIR
jgi:hypothetical protein